MRLITIKVSHYNEKARWALDRYGIVYAEEPYMPVMHMLPVRRAVGRQGRRDNVSSRTSTPVLILDDGTCLTDSREIVSFASDRFGSPETTLYPCPEAAEVEVYLHDRLGPHTRRIAYRYLLPDARLMGQLADANVSPRQARWFRRLSPAIAALVTRGLGVTPERAEKSAGYVRKEFDAYARRLDGRRYLLEDRFTAADLAFACMAAPVLLPGPDEGYGATLPRPDDCHPDFERLVSEMREHPAGRYALRLFAEDRGCLIPGRQAA